MIAAATALALATVKVTALLLAGAAAARLARRAPARLRHAVWTLVLAGCLVIPVLQIAFPARLLVVRPGSAAVAIAAPRAAPVNPEASIARRAEETESPPAAGVSAARRFAPTLTDWPALVMIVWLAGATASAAPLALGVLQRRRFAMHAGPPDARYVAAMDRARTRLGVAVRPRLVVAPDAVPAAWGIMRPVLALPASAAAWDAETLNAVLCHELAHLRRRDVLWIAMAEGAAVAFWFHPGVWLSRRRLLREQELATDALVIASGLERHGYARALVGVARALGGVGRPAAALRLFGRRPELDVRIRAVLSAPADGHRMRLLPAFAVAVAVLVVGPLAPARPSIAASAPVIAADAGPPAAVLPMQSGSPAAPPASERPPAVVSHPLSAVTTVVREGVEEDGWTGLRSGALDGLSARQLARFAALGIPPSYIREMRGAGLQLARAEDTERLWALGVTPGFVRELNEAGVAVASPSYAESLWVQQLPPRFAAELAAEGVDVSSPAQVGIMWIQGVTAEYARDLRRAGLARRTPAELVDLRIHGVPADFVAALVQTGLRGLTAMEARRLHNFGVDPRSPADLVRVAAYDQRLRRVLTALSSRAS